MTSPDSYFKVLLELPVISGTNLDIPTVNPNDSVEKVIDQLIDHNVGAIIAVHKKDLIGIITEKDVLEKVLNEELEPANTQVKDIMSSPERSLLIDIFNPVGSPAPKNGKRAPDFLALNNSSGTVTFNNT